MYIYHAALAGSSRCSLSLYALSPWVSRVRPKFDSYHANSVILLQVIYPLVAHKKSYTHYFLAHTIFGGISHDLCCGVFSFCYIFCTFALFVFVTYDLYCCVFSFCYLYKNLKETCKGEPSRSRV